LGPLSPLKLGNLIKGKEAWIVGMGGAFHHIGASSTLTLLLGYHNGSNSLRISFAPTSFLLVVLFMPFQAFAISLPISACILLFGLMLFWLP